MKYRPTVFVKQLNHTSHKRAATNSDVVVIEIWDAEILSFLEVQSLTDFVKQRLSTGLRLSTLTPLNKHVGLLWSQFSYFWSHLYCCRAAAWDIAHSIDCRPTAQFNANCSCTPAVQVRPKITKLTPHNRNNGKNSPENNLQQGDHCFAGNIISRTFKHLHNLFQTHSTAVFSTWQLFMASSQVSK